MPHRACHSPIEPPSGQILADDMRWREVPVFVERWHSNRLQPQKPGGACGIAAQCQQFVRLLAP